MKDLLKNNMNNSFLTCFLTFQTSQFLFVSTQKLCSKRLSNKCKQMIRQNTHRLSRMAYVGEYTDRMLLTLKCNTLEQTTDPEKATCHCRTLAPSSVLPFQSSLLGENQPFCWNPNSAGVHSSPVASRLYPPSKHSTILLLKGLPEDQHYQYQLGLY